ncbi:MAG: HPr(Ser) kinase/phosphatase [Elusimicrobia bacterium]|nr:HPr(Ser) kinase/phosphatase [Elusimicrobiota bacterium]
MRRLSVRDLLKAKETHFILDLLAGADGLDRILTVSEIHRPGLAFTGYLDYFPGERVQILGLGEHSYLATLSSKQRLTSAERVFSAPEVPCVILTRGLTPHPELLQVAKTLRVPFLRTGLETARIIEELTVYLEEELAPTTTVHGVLVAVYGLGVLLLGDSGIGKSECALELVKRGHMLIADDLVEIKQRAGGFLVGTGSELIRHHMELRGLGIIDVKAVFGIVAILDRARIELVIRLEEWNEQVEYDRVGIAEQSATILEVKVPEIVMPVRPGRNLAVLIEVAALNQRLKNLGQFTAQELNERLIRHMAPGTSNPGPPFVPPAR